MLKTFTDFIGQPITAGSFLAAGGAGNAKAEYGMILYYVSGEKNGKLEVVRLNVDYYQSGMAPTVRKNGVVAGGTTIYPKASTITNTNRYVVVQLPELVREVFTRYMNGDASVVELMSVKAIASWLHGTEIVKAFTDEPRRPQTGEML